MLLYAFFDFLQESGVFMEMISKKWVVSVVGAGCASIFACIFSQPGDMILTETYRPSNSETVEKTSCIPRGTGIPPSSSLSQSNSFFAVTNRIYQRQGLATFFTGTGARIIHVGLIITSQLVIYDLVKQMLGLPATGSH